MSKRFRRRPSPALVVACLALFVALGGTALALQKNSVKSKHIKDGQVKSADIRDGAVKDDQLSPAAFNPTDIGLDPNSTDPVGRFGILPDAVSTGEVEDGSLTGDDIAFASLTGTDIRNDSLTGSDVDELTLENPMWAAVNGTGSLRRAGQNASSSRLREGVYAVSFPGHDVRACAYSATSLQQGSGTEASTPLTRQLGAVPAPAGPASEVHVRVTGDEDDDEVDSAFSLVVVC